MLVHANAKLGLAGRLALVSRIEEGRSLRAAAVAFRCLAGDCSPLVAPLDRRRALQGCLAFVDSGFGIPQRMGCTGVSCRVAPPGRLRLVRPCAVSRRGSGGCDGAPSRSAGTASHAEWFHKQALELLAAPAPRRPGAASTSELDRFRDDDDNARAALEWALSVGNPVLPKVDRAESLAGIPSTRSRVICVG